MQKMGDDDMPTAANERTHLLDLNHQPAAALEQSQAQELHANSSNNANNNNISTSNLYILCALKTKSPSLNRRIPARRKKPIHWLHYVVHYSIALLISCLVVLVEYQPPSLNNSMYGGGRRAMIGKHYHDFPDDFVWGAATSAYQIEGGREERGASIWDTFCDSGGEGSISDGTNGDVACDHYHKMEEDVRLMKRLGLRAYRFSIAWTRILPHGNGNGNGNGDAHLDDEVNPAGIDFYNRLIDALIEADIVPYVTLFHWDLPQALQDEYGGWMDRRIVNDFANYAEICFRHFGDRVQHWITINESWTIAVNGYNNHVHAPGHYKHAGTETYLVAHHLLLAHATAVKVYRDLYANADDKDNKGFPNATKTVGMIGMANCGDYRYPADPSHDQEAAERAMVFQLAWFADPIYFGDYPSDMKRRLGRRLPRFTREERRLLKGSSDFFGLNHYSSLLAAEPAEKEASYEGYWADMHVDFSSNDKWKRNDMGWSIVPNGCRELLLWISNRYDNPILIMTENGSAEPEPDLETALRDEGRRAYFEHYLRASAEAIETGDVDMRGYFAWSLMDNFEWQFGYQRRFGICRVDFETQERTPKSSALWYAETIRANGHNIRRKEFSYLE